MARSVGTPGSRSGGREGGLEARVSGRGMGPDGQEVEFRELFGYPMEMIAGGAPQGIVGAVGRGVLGDFALGAAGRLRRVALAGRLRDRGIEPFFAATQAGGHLAEGLALRPARNLAPLVA